MGEEKRRHYEFYNQDDPVRWGRAAMPSEIKIVHYWTNKTGKNTGVEKVVELGCGKGALRNIHQNYFGIDISLGVLKEYFPEKNCLQASIEELPLKSNIIDVIFSFATIEHVPHPEKTFSEIDRILAKDGIAIISPAWFCRPWAAKGLPVKRYNELKMFDKLIKLSIPLRNNLIWRFLFVFPNRVSREILAFFLPKSYKISYKRLKPNLNEYIYTDCDAFVSIDPHAVILFYKLKGYKILTELTLLKRLLVRNEPIVVQKI